MINYLPKLYNDELLYSFISRYHVFAGNINFKDTLADLFGSTNLIATIEFPSMLANLVIQLSKEVKLDLDSLIQKHTLFPVYAPFLPTKRKNVILKKMIYEDGKGIKTQIGLIAGGVGKNKGLRYCPLCSSEEISKYGEAYFHTLHQVQGVLVCTNHNCFLREYPISQNQISRIEFIKFEKSIIDINMYDVVNNRFGKLLEVAKGAKYLIEHCLDNYNQQKIHSKYVYILYQKKLLNLNGRVRQKDLHEEFIAFYGEEVLKKLESNLNYDNEYNWLKVLLRKPGRVVHPIRNVLLMIFLCGSVANFFSITNSRCNKIKYPCLNPFCENYNKCTIDNYKITADFKTRQPIGTFYCSCGFIYSRKMNSNIYRIGRVKTYGQLWEDSLKYLILERKYSIRGIASQMRCDFKTIVKYADKLGLKYLLNTLTDISNKISVKIRLPQISSENYKNDMVNFITDNNEATRQQIRKNLSKQYMWLYRNEKQWLDENLPPRVKNNVNKINNRVDWNKRDDKMLQTIKEQYEELIVADNRTRITKSLIGRKIGKLGLLEKCIDKMPKCKEYLQQILETLEQYQLYRVHKVVKNMVMNNEELKKWIIIKKAGLRAKVTEVVNIEIDVVMEQHSNFLKKTERSK